MAIFYHVSTDLKHDGKFEPRIPTCRHKDAEDDQTPRVSVAPTIEDCLTAIPGGGGHLDQLNMDQRGYYKVFRVDTEKLGIPEKDIVAEKVLYESDLVRDASESHEHWILVPFQVPKEDAFLIRLRDWEETCLDILPHAIFKIAGEKYEGDSYEAYEQEHGKNVPSSIGIREPVYIPEEVDAGTEVVLFVDNDDEKDSVEEFLLEEYGIEDVTLDCDELVFTPSVNVNLRPLFLHHADVAMVDL